jgi:hypothetical protein
MREDNKMKSVVVDPAMFAEVAFKMATPKEEYRANKDAPRNQKVRKVNGVEVPVWTVKCATSTVAPNGRVDDDFIMVSVPSETDPSELFDRGDDVRFERLQFGVADTKTGYSLWFSADAIHPAGASVRSVSASA